MHTRGHRRAAFRPRPRAGLGALAGALVFVGIVALVVVFRDRLFPSRQASQEEHGGVETPAAPVGEAGAPPQEPAPGKATSPKPEPGVRDGVTGVNLGLDPFDRMEDPQYVTIPKGLPGNRLANVTDFRVRWLHAWGDAKRLRNSWRLLADAAGGLAASQEQADAARTAYLLAAATAEGWRADFYAETGTKPAAK